MESQVNNAIEIFALEPKGFSLLFYPLNVGSKYDGHMWDSLIKAHCKKESISLDGIVLDSEIEMFCALSYDKNILQLLSDVIQKLLIDNISFEEALTNAGDVDDSDEDLTTAEFVKWMKEAGFDLDTLHEFEFSLSSFKDQNQAYLVKKFLQEKGYNSSIEIIDGEVFFESIVEEFPQESKLHSIESCFKRVAMMFNVEYEGFGLVMKE